MKARLTILAALPIFASSHALAMDIHAGKPEIVATAALATGARERAARAQLSPQAGGPEEFSPLALDALALSEQGLDENVSYGQSVVRLYPVGGGAGGAAVPTARAPAGKDGGEGTPRAKNASLPEPGSWAMILAGLLGVGAIARRRMSG